jgi:hypothetical protein
LMLALALALAATLAFLAWRDVLPLLARIVRVVEVRLLPAEDADLAQLGPIPPDIEQLAQGESEEWAREAVRERAWELFRTTKNWDEAKRILFTERQLHLFGGGPDTGVN